MSDPLASIASPLSALELSKAKFRCINAAEVLKGVATAPKAHEEVAARFGKSKVDVVLGRGVLAAPYLRFISDEGLVQRLKGKNASEVFFSSDTSAISFQKPLPRLLKTAQEITDLVPTGGWPANQASICARAGQVVYCGGGVQHTHTRLLQHLAKQGERPSRLPMPVEVVEALKATGRTFPDDAGLVPRHLGVGSEGVEVIAGSSNGFPVLSNLHDEAARAHVLELAGGMRRTLDEVRARGEGGGVEAYLDYLREKHAGLMLCMGKTKLDLYKVGKAQSGMMRFYYVLPRHMALIMQQATQPLAALWKTQASDWRTGIGKSFAYGGAERLVDDLWRRAKASHDAGGAGMAWSHCGDDSIVVRWDGSRLELFSLDCTAFDLTQHGEVSRLLKDIFAQQLARVDYVSGAVWRHFARSRVVTINGSVTMKTAHGGPSGMMLQSEVNDTLMEILLARVEGSKWEGRKELDAVLQDYGSRLGFEVRLEDYISMVVPPKVDRPLVYVLERVPFLYLGYHLYAQDGEVRCVMDLNRLLPGMPYLTGGFSAERQEAGTRAALTLAGLTLAFGVPPSMERFNLVPAFERLREVASSALQARAAEVEPGQVQAEIEKYVFAGLKLDDTSVAGLLAALARPPEHLWLGRVRVTETAPVPFSWGDEEETFFADQARRLLMPSSVEFQAAQGRLVGSTPAQTAEAAEKAAAAARARAERENFKGLGAERPKGRKIRNKRSGVLYDPDEFDEYDSDSVLFELD